MSRSTLQILNQLYTEVKSLAEGTNLNNKCEFKRVWSGLGSVRLYCSNFHYMLFSYSSNDREIYFSIIKLLERSQSIDVSILVSTTATCAQKPPELNDIMMLNDKTRPHVSMLTHEKFLELDREVLYRSPPTWRQQATIYSGQCRTSSIWIFCNWWWTEKCSWWILR